MFRSIPLLALALAAAPAFADPIPVLSYDMINGGGQTSGGGRNYWDANYNGSGATTTDGAYLSGGTGALTDGVIGTGSWSDTANYAGTGQYVGWNDGYEDNPTITFHFAGTPTITSISIYVDNSGYGGVYGPNAIWLDGVAQTYSNPAGQGPITFTGLSLTGATHTIQLGNAERWVMVSEISFDGGAVPEPASWAMMLGGFGLVGGAMRRRTLATT